MTVLAAATTLLLWASAFTAIRVAVEAFPPGPLALLRFLIASLALGAWVLLRRARACADAIFPAWRSSGSWA